MQGISAYWLIAILVLPVGTASIVIHIFYKGTHLGQRGFALRVIPVLVLSYVLVGLARENTLQIELLYLLLLLIYLVNITLVPYWAMERLADMGGASKSQAILCALPILGHPVVISLMFRGEAASYYPML